jgi:hypothetical protein
VEAAHIPWRPLGRLLVEQGLLTADELELALAKQEETGRLLGQTIVECGFVSGPELSNALAAQYGIELTAETGFGTGLRTEIQRRHETERRRIVQAVPDVVDEPEPPAAAEPDELDEPAPDEASLHEQLEKQWAKLAAAEERLAESHRELAALAQEHDRRRSQAARLVHRVRDRDRRIERLAADVRGCDSEINRLRHENAELEREAERRRAQAAGFAKRLREPVLGSPPLAVPDAHLVFVQLSGRYELVVRPGPPPPRNTVVELPELSERALIVSGVGRSPLPGDARPCIFVQPA